MADITAPSSLNNFGVFTGNLSVGQALQHPMQRFRFTVTLPGFGNTADTAGTHIRYNTNTVAIPRWSTDVVKIHGGNSEASITGKIHWATFDLEMKDPIDGSVEAEIEAQKSKQANPYTTAVSAVGVNEKFECIIDFHNGGGLPLITWDIVGCVLESVDYGSFDYSSSDPKNVTMTIQPDNMLVFKNCTSVGTAQGGELITWTENSSVQSAIDSILATGVPVGNTGA